MDSLVVLFTALLVCVPGSVRMQAERSVFFAGFANTGDDGEARNTLPIISRAIGAGVAVSEAALAGWAYLRRQMVFDLPGDTGDANRNTTLAYIGREPATVERISQHSAFGGLVLSVRRIKPLLNGPPLTASFR